MSLSQQVIIYRYLYRCTNIFYSYNLRLCCRGFENPRRPFLTVTRLMHNNMEHVFVSFRKRKRKRTYVRIRFSLYYISSNPLCTQPPAKKCVRKKNQPFVLCIRRRPNETPNLAHYTRGYMPPRLRAAATARNRHSPT